MSQLRDRIASMAHAFRDVWRKNQVRALAQDVGALEASIAELETDLQQAREDEAWARNNGVVTSMASAWITSQRPETLTFGGSINAAIRALRAKVEGVAR